MCKTSSNGLTFPTIYVIVFVFKSSNNIFGTSLGETSVRFVSDHYHYNLIIHQLHVTIIKTYHNYLTTSLLSPTHLHEFKKTN